MGVRCVALLGIVSLICSRLSRRLESAPVPLSSQLFGFRAEYAETAETY